ncbi:DUF4183 domain-containing protein [Paenibacillus flagellatus]|uniref:DUF4183 domain-containing protein n=1 Tax=Paenibacillus flagellatus TaxID=2211139 RepID=A0A2V5K2S9_9BACL|nr:DUF4183 domain-containing protein [Paenibacillus flagellatus]PYI53481.1 hypothetical protein DLM86_17060 [Paenibacillus flagellatus]
MDLTAPVVLPASEFTNDDGAEVASFPTLGPFSYTNLYVNGMMQGGGSFRATPTALTLNAGDGTIMAGTPIVLEVMNFTAVPLL